MGATTEIQWCDSTVNPTSGCDGCELWNSTRTSCYAGAIHGRFSPSAAYPGPFELIELHPGRMRAAAAWSDLRGKPRRRKPWLDGVPRMIFISDMSDALSADVGFDYLEEEIIANVVSEQGRRHIWLWLTKRPQRMARFGSWLDEVQSDYVCDGWPPNLWVGVSVTTQATTCRIADLMTVGDEKTTRFVSVEPLVEPIDLSSRVDGLDWVIVGGESGKDARPCDLDGVRSIIGQCRSADVPVFVKQLGSRPVEVHPLQGGYGADGVWRHREVEHKYRHRHGGDWGEWPPDIAIREVPRPTK